MIHYTCDLCKRVIDPHDDLRYVVKIEISAAFDPVGVEDEEDDRDHLQEIQDLLEQLETSHGDVGEDVHQELQFDLCPECRRRFCKNPLGRETAGLVNFSKN